MAIKTNDKSKLIINKPRNIKVLAKVDLLFENILDA